MHERCPACGLKFEREEGYFLGAMYIGYALGLGTIALFGLVLWWLAHWTFQTTVTVAVLLFLPLAPLLTIVARVLWIYLDQTIDPDRS
jgi:drug/metabolite transporter (DMT)-like permease